MIASENNNQDQPIERDEFKKNTPIPEGYQSNQSNIKFHATENIQKNAVPHQRNELNPNQEQRPDRRNPQRNIDK
jgi:hypothetical protein